MHVARKAAITRKRTVGVRSPRSPRTWLSIRIELVEGRGERRWPRPGRLFAADRNHTFAQLALAVDDAFARWDRSHLHEFQMSDGTRFGITDPEFDNEEVLDGRKARLLRLHIVPEAPIPYFGWGAIPDQYGRRWDGDDGEGQPPPDPEFADLPPLRPWWGSGAAEWFGKGRSD